MILVALFSIVLGLSLIFDRLLFVVALPPLPPSIITYAAIGLLMLGYGLGVLTDEIRDIPITRTLDHLERNPDRKRQVYAWMLGYYSKYVLYEDRNMWGDILYDDKWSQQSRLLGVGDEELFAIIRNFPTLTKDESNQIIGLGLEAAGPTASSEIPLEKMPERIQLNLSETNRLLKKIEARLGRGTIAYKCFLIPVLAFQFSKYPNLRFVKMTDWVVEMRNPTELSKTLRDFERRLDNQFIPKDLLVSLRELVEEVSKPPSLKPGESKSDLEIERVGKLRDIDRLLGSVEGHLRDAGWRGEAV